MTTEGGTELPDPGRHEIQGCSTHPADTPTQLLAGEDDGEPEESHILRGTD